MLATRKRQRPKLATARSYYRLAGKASRAGNSGEAEAYRRQADRYVEMDRQEQAAAARRKAGDAQARAWLAARRKDTPPKSDR
jgi:hypothetical protein